MNWRSVVGVSEKLPSATSLKTAASRVVLPASEGRESFAVNEGHNAAPRVVGQGKCGALLDVLGGLSVCGVDRRLIREVRLLQRHRGGNPLKAAESGLLCAKPEVDGVELTVVEIYG